MPTRYDIPAVPLQGGYIAKQCPVRAQNDAIQPGQPVPPDPFTERLFANGNAFGANVVAEIRRLHPGTVVIEGLDSAAKETATAEAMAAGASPILNARLPADLAGRRVGKPDLLVAAARGGYRPVDIKGHMNLEPATARAALPGLCSSLGTLNHEDAVVDEHLAAKKKEGDSQFITGGASGLKVVAPLAGYRWEMDDAGGGESMVMYDVATNGAADADDAREWLLTCNRGVFEATHAVREWMERVGPSIPSVESLGAAAE